MLRPLCNARIDSRYTNLIRDIYDGAFFHVKMSEDLNTERISTRRRVRQGDSISPKVFTLALEDVFKKLQWEKKGVCIDRKYLNHLCFADDVVLMSRDEEELRSMLAELKSASQEVGLQMNQDKDNEPE